MSSAAALLIASHKAVQDAHTYGATEYFKGMRDMASAVFRAVHGCSYEMSLEETLVEAVSSLEELDEAERVTLVTAAMDCLRVSRANTVAATLTAV